MIREFSVIRYALAARAGVGGENESAAAFFAGVRAGYLRRSLYTSTQNVHNAKMQNYIYLCTIM